MKYTRRDVGTDVATIGIWDPAHVGPDPDTLDYSELRRRMGEDADAGRLFFIDTFADGGYSSDVYLDEVPPKDLLQFYSAVQREYLIVCVSGELVVAGTEYYTQRGDQVGCPAMPFSLEPGAYAIRVYELNAADLTDARTLSEVVGAEDYAYYESRESGCPWGCVFFLGLIIGVIALYVFDHMAYSPLLAVPLILRYILSWWKRSRDLRFQAVSQKIEEFVSSFPHFIFVLRPLKPGETVAGGYHSLA